jgi:hypothetical protein
LDYLTLIGRIIIGKAAVAIDLSAEDRRTLEGLAGRRRTAQDLARRTRIVLLAAEGLQNTEICASIDIDENSAGKYAQERLG